MAFVLADNRGEGLMELTQNRVKPAVHFGGKLRIIDFTLSNALNSGIRRIAVATQYKAYSLIHHLQKGWNFLRSERNETFDILPASQRLSDRFWYRGSADAVYQNADIIEAYAPDFLIVLAGDHVYKMDYELMLQQHVGLDADLTLACVRLPRTAALRQGLARVDSEGRVLELGKELVRDGSSSSDENALANMGVYVFRTGFLLDLLRRDAERVDADHTFDTIISTLIREAKVVAHEFDTSCVRTNDRGPIYWQNLDDLDAYFAANIGLTDVVPDLDLYDKRWPLWTHSEMTAPTKFVHNVPPRRGNADTSLVGGGCIISGSLVSRSVLFNEVRVHSYATLESAIVFPRAEIGQHARLRKVIVESGVRIPERTVIGDDPEADARRFRRTEDGVCLVTRAMAASLAEARE